MYSISSEDQPREILDLPQSSVGAPCPMLLASDHSLLLAYYLDDLLPPNWAHTTIHPAMPNDSDDLCALVAFKMPFAHMLGSPNDEAFSGHPLASRGLSPYTVSEVERSSWIRTLIQMNSVHPYHSAKAFAKYRHYIFAFHDSTFECVAESFKMSLYRGSVWVVLERAQNEA
jgi:hypothetical protein